MQTEMWPLADHDLARRLERAEGATNAAFVEARAALQPEVGATWMHAAGVYAMYDGAASPLTQTFGLGLFDTVGDAEFAQLEAFFRERGAPVFHEASPFISPDTLARLNERGYRPVEFSTVLIRPAGLPADGTEISVRPVGDDEAALWSRTAAAGWFSESDELAVFIEQLGRVIARSAGVHCFLAELGGRPIAAAALSIHDNVALLAGASTIPSGRRQGAQRALLAARLRFAVEHSADLAMMVAQPGSGSQRNAERAGFRPVYTRTKWQLRDEG
jgi:hypothetical protein